MAVFSISVWACVSVETSDEEQAGTVTQGSNMQGSNMQGSNMQGSNMQGSSMQGMSLMGFQFDGASLGGVGLTNLRVDKGEVVAEQGGVTLRGAALIGASLQAQFADTTVSPAAVTLAPYRIANVQPELAAYDPTQTGATYLYTIERWDEGAAAWQPACAADLDGRRVAIPVAGTWDDHGDRSDSTTLFTFGCTAGVIAKCYRWGYRPWLTGYGADMKTMHWTCTRLARADYCGDGTPHTVDGTWVNVWDNLPAPGPIQRHGGLLPPAGMLFEAGWGPHGAVCLSHARWLTSLGSLIANTCPDRLIPPGLGGVACDSVLDAVQIDPSVRLFNESYINVDLTISLGL